MRSASQRSRQGENVPEIAVDTVGGHGGIVIVEIEDCAGDGGRRERDFKLDRSHPDLTSYHHHRHLNTRYRTFYEHEYNESTCMFDIGTVGTVETALRPGLCRDNRISQSYASTPSCVEGEGIDEQSLLDTNRFVFVVRHMGISVGTRWRASRPTFASLGALDGIHAGFYYEIDICSPRLLCARGLNTPTFSQKYTPHRRLPTLVALDPKCRTPALSYPSTSSPCLSVPPAYAQYADNEEEVLV
ncbi:hypothetical protein ARMSODRAFT_1004901 [Armillaria solidipes]|uniref:Uncharacterized protein n=1 Tax=Armillaria solidipes TaxID=1076256 RepID=A0A2H3BGX5_9AGAR|nr:hypothetical protein ARMSODRAFT_1004901 [Armillaria solidipes]